MPDKFRIFDEEMFDIFATATLGRMRQNINGESDQYITSVDQEAFINHISSQFRIEPVVIHFEGLSVDEFPKQVSIKAEDFPGGGFAWNVVSGRTYHKDALIYHLPFSGEKKFLEFRPNKHWSQMPTVYLLENNICFDVINFKDDANEIDARVETIVSTIKDNHDNLNQEILAYNKSLPQQAREIFQTRLTKIQGQQKLVSALKVPIRKSNILAETFAVPTVRKKISISKPQASLDLNAPTWVLEQQTYDQILRVIQDTGRNFERFPSTSAGKQEEDLRDFLLMILEPHFEGSTTAETFNKQGKTDILMRYDKKNVFVGECKVWKGDKVHTQTINQILSYLTFRDSKAAIIYFVHNKEMSSTLATIEANTPKHPNYVCYVGKVEDTWLSYKFHLPDDAGRTVQIAVMCFHIPN